MTPQQHIDKAEKLLAQAEDRSVEGLPGVRTNLLLRAVAHTWIAIAVESGVPHGTAQQGGQ